MNSTIRLYCPALVSAGVTFYYTGKAGKEMLSPNIEDGFFAYSEEMAVSVAKRVKNYSAEFDERFAVQRPMHFMSATEMDATIADGVEFCAAWLQGKLRKTGAKIDGDLAAHFFQGENMEKLNAVFQDYLTQELALANSSTDAPESD